MEQWKENTPRRPEDTAEEVRGLFQQLMDQEQQRETPAAPQEAPATDEPVTEETPAAVSAPTQAAVPPVPARPAEPVSRDELLPDEETPEELPEGIDYSALPLILLTPDEEDSDYWPVDEPSADNVTEELPAPPAVKRNPLLVIWEAFRANIPAKGDSRPELIRKLAFLLALVVLISSLGYILYDVCILPSMNNAMYQELSEQYDPDNDRTVLSGNYPAGMLESFCGLYDQNNEVRGWISYHATGKKDFLNIDYPIMHSGDNDKYLTVDFTEKRNKNGALFFDMRNTIEPFNYSNKSLIVYGHNMASGQMFAGLNKFIGNVNNARAAATLTLSTLFERSEYKVFAVVLTDEQESNEWYFDTRRTVFSTNGEFMEYVAELRAHSLFDYPVEVAAEDELLVLSTCTAPSSAKVKDGRLVVIARKVRAGESTAVEVNRIVKNDDVIMPRAWYTLQDKELHPYYSGAAIDVDTTTTTTDWLTPNMGSTEDVLGTTGSDTTGSGTSADETDGSTTTTSKKTGTTSATKPGATTKPTSSSAAKPGNTTSTAKPTESTSAQEPDQTTSTEKPAEDTSTDKADESTTAATEESTTTSSQESTTSSSEGGTDSSEAAQGAE